MVKKAVILAAGKGSRLNGNGSDLPKPLVKVAGVGLLKRALLTARRAGIGEFVIVTGFRGREIREAISSDSQIDFPIQWVENTEWERGNGVSALKAREYVEGSFLLLMSDHLFDPQVLMTLRNTPIGGGELVLGVDRRIGQVFDMDDATKVLLAGDRVVQIDKALSSFNAVDTGAFLCTSSLFNALEQAVASGAESLSAGCRILAEAGEMRAVDVGRMFWMDVDTPEALRHAERALIGTLGKPTDGLISSHFNRKISRRITRMLVRTPVTPNTLSLATMCVSFLAAWLVAAGDYLHLALGGLLFQFASVVDGCDGEVAKLKFLRSHTGEWVDTIADNLSYLAFFVGIIYGMYQWTGEAYTITLGWVALSLNILGVSLISLYLQTIGSGSLATFNAAFSEDVPEERRGWFYRVCCSLKFACRRDFFAALFCVLAVADFLGVMYWVFTVGSFLVATGVFGYTGYMLRTRGVWPAPVSGRVATEKLLSEKAD